jgi:hypothetical protein
MIHAINGLGLGRDFLTSRGTDAPSDMSMSASKALKTMTRQRHKTQE